MVGTGLLQERGFLHPEDVGTVTGLLLGDSSRASLIIESRSRGEVMKRVLAFSTTFTRFVMAYSLSCIVNIFLHRRMESNGTISSVATRNQSFVKRARSCLTLHSERKGNKTCGSDLRQAVNGPILVAVVRQPQPILILVKLEYYGQYSAALI